MQSALNNPKAAKQQGVDEKLAEALRINMLGKQAIVAKNYEIALQFFQQSLVIRQEIGDFGGEAAMLNNISQVYSERGDDETALLYLQQSFEVFEKAGDVPGTCAALINMGHIYWTHGVQKDAMLCWSSAYQRAKSMEHTQALAILETLAKNLGGTGLEFWE
jgi:tetratricopeptide (TPR) repeat protein